MKSQEEADRKRTSLDFTNTVSEAFAFLGDLGFSEIESTPTLVRYRNGDLEVHVYHGRQSFEIGLEIARGAARYSISEILRATDPEQAGEYRNYAATEREEIVDGLARLSALLRRNAERALRDDPEFFSNLEDQRKVWAEEYALDVLAGQLRPKAEAAFRSGDYRHAAELYERIRPRLSGVELKKLALAKERTDLQVN